MQFLEKAMLVIAGIIHLLPLPGLIGAANLNRLYGLAFDDPNIIILMRHRAVLFGLIGALLIMAAFRDDVVWIAVAGGIVSAAAFAWLAWSVGGYNDAIARVVVADVVALACLVVAAVCHAVAAPIS